MRNKLMTSISDTIQHGARQAIALAIGSHSSPASRPVVGLFAQLTSEQKRAFLAYDGPIESGDPSLPKLRDRRNRPTL